MVYEEQWFGMVATNESASNQAKMLKQWRRIFVPINSSSLLHFTNV
jgi:hypothetical protein